SSAGTFGPGGDHNLTTEVKTQVGAKMPMTYFGESPS
ncbi:MAG: hypothetical protein ACI9OB_000181, partial [Nonlabens sp.]